MRWSRKRICAISENSARLREKSRSSLLGSRSQDGRLDVISTLRFLDDPHAAFVAAFADKTIEVGGNTAPRALELNGGVLALGDKTLYLFALHQAQWFPQNLMA